MKGFFVHCDPVDPERITIVLNGDTIDMMNTLLLRYALNIRVRDEAMMDLAAAVSNAIEDLHPRNIYNA